MPHVLVDMYTMGTDQPIQWPGLLGRLVLGLSSQGLDILWRGKGPGIGGSASGNYFWGLFSGRNIG